MPPYTTNFIIIVNGGIIGAVRFNNYACNKIDYSVYYKCLLPSLMGGRRAQNVRAYIFIGFSRLAVGAAGVQWVTRGSVCAAGERTHIFLIPAFSPYLHRLLPYSRLVWFQLKRPVSILNNIKTLKNVNSTELSALNFVKTLAISSIREAFSGWMKLTRIYERIMCYHYVSGNYVLLGWRKVTEYR